MKFRSISLACALLITSAVAGLAAGPKLPKNIVPSYDKTALNTPLQVKAPDYYSDERALVSPDGKYVARFTGGEGEYGYLTVYRRAGKKNVWAKRYAVSRKFDDVTSCIWVPKRAHCLIVSAGYENEASIGIAMWDGPGKMRVLKRLKVKFNVPDNYAIYGTSPDGRVLYYEHYGTGTPDPDYKRDTVQKLILPR